MEKDKANQSDDEMEMEFKDCEEGGEGEEEVKDEKVEISDEIERSKVGILRALAEREDPSVKDFDDLMVRRFLRARELDIEKASTMFIKFLSWRKTFMAKGFISESEITSQLPSNKLCMQGYDKQGRPIIVGFGARHKPVKGNLEEVKRYVVYTLEKLCARMPKGQEKFLAIVDLEGWGYSNSDIRAYVSCLSILQDCYPERLAKVFVVHVPYIFWTVWKVIYPFIDSRTKKKIVFVENKKLTTTLLDEIDASQLPDIYGGKLPLVPVQDS